MPIVTFSNQKSSYLWMNFKQSCSKAHPGQAQACAGCVLGLSHSREDTAGHGATASAQL